MPVQEDSNSEGAPQSAGAVSSPASTGGAGNVFEQAVGAYFLAQLLVGACPPILIDCVITEVSFQNECRGWRTDDLLLVGQSDTGTTRKLTVQVKRTFTVSSIDADCRTAMLDLWSDFHHHPLFSADTDRFAIVVQIGTNTLLRDFGSLLDCARASKDAEDFVTRLDTSGLLSSRAVRYCDEVIAIISESEKRQLSRAEIFPLLRVLHVLSLDLATSTRQSEVSAKDLLGYTATRQEKADSARRTWNELVLLAAEGSAAARAFRQQDLPEEMRRRHSTCGLEQPMLVALREHSSVITSGIRSTIGKDLHLSRTNLVEQVLTALEQSRIVLLSGAAGNGKSAVAKEVVALLSRDYFTFAFRSEEFAQAHFDTTLALANIPGRAATLRIVLAGQERKIVLVESVERLLEKSTRDAFSDLLTMISSDPTFRLILTCRDYSADLVRTAFLTQTEVDHDVVEVPPLTDAELDKVQVADSSLAIPLGNSTLRKILSNPYVLDKARSINWSAESARPASEREFRSLFWREIVRAEHHPGAGMPARRDSVFTEIALRRARALSMYASSAALDPDALAALVSDSLVVREEKSEDLVAPAHDVLEDWAILRWIDRLYAEIGHDLSRLQEGLGAHPALRRGYRKWLGELLERSSSAGEDIFREALQARHLTPSFVDDTLVSLLQSTAAGALIENHQTELLTGARERLKRVVHLVRLACVTSPTWLQRKVGIVNIPHGTAWPALLGVIQRGWTDYDAENAHLILGFVEDWAKGVTPQEPYPSGAAAAADLACALLDRFDNYSHDEELKRILKVLARIPGIRPERYKALLSVPRGGGRDRSMAAEELQKMVFSGPFYESLPTARDLAPALVAALRTHLLCTDRELRKELKWPSALDIELYFGLRRRVSHDYFPASAYRTPMLPLLRQHPRIAINFLIEVFNHVAEWYVHPRIGNRLEPAFEVIATLPGERTKAHWCNARLWNLYRGTSVGPDVLQSYLMGLERWLHELAKQQPEMLDPIMIELLSKTDNGSLAGVVAGVATAFPFQSGETLLSLLSIREYVDLDRQRMVSDLSPMSQVLPNVMARRDVEHKFFDAERKEADTWPHRRNDLEAAVRNLQMTHFAGRVQALLDEHRRRLGDVSTQDEADRLWRLALHRMDLRGYKVAEDAATSEELRERGFIRLEARDPEPDIREMLDRNAPRLAEQQNRMSLMMWAHRAFKRELDASDLESWREKLQVALKSDDEKGNYSLEEVATGGAAPAIIAAVAGRDHWDDLSNAEKAWCVKRITTCVLAQGDSWERLARAQRFDMAPDRSCAFATVALAARKLTGEMRSAVDEALVVALTHPVEEVRWYAVHGAAELWAHDKVLATRCVFAIAMEANTLATALTREESEPYEKRRRYEDIASDAARQVRCLFSQPNGLREEAYDRLELENWYGAEAQNRILVILSRAPMERLAGKAFVRAAQALVASWKTKHDHPNRRERNYEAELRLARLLEEFVMRAPFDTAKCVLEPILGAVDCCPSEVHSFIEGIVLVEDREPHTQQFWAVWKLFVERTKLAPWLTRIDDRYSSGAEVVHALFLGMWWKEETRHWRSLEGYDQNVHALFEDLKPSACVMEAYVRFLYHVGDRSLPDAFVRIASKLKIADPKSLIASSNTIYQLEIILERYVYPKPLLLKARTELRNSVLALLEVLIELGSSAAFKMRDDFITPVAE